MKPERPIREDLPSSFPGVDLRSVSEIFRDDCSVDTLEKSFPPAPGLRKRKPQKKAGT